MARGRTQIDRSGFPWSEPRRLATAELAKCFELQGFPATLSCHAREDGPRSAIRVPWPFIHVELLMAIGSQCGQVNCKRQGRKSKTCFSFFRFRQQLLIHPVGDGLAQLVVEILVA